MQANINSLNILGAAPQLEQSQYALYSQIVAAFGEFSPLARSLWDAAQAGFGSLQAGLPPQQQPLKSARNDLYDYDSFL